LFANENDLKMCESKMICSPLFRKEIRRDWCV